MPFANQILDGPAFPKQSNIYNMKKGILLFATLVVFPLFLIISAFTNPDSDVKPEQGGMWSNTGSPGDGNEDCASCHTDGDYGVENTWISIDIPSSGYLTGETYTGTVTITGGSASTLKGFSIVAENSSNAHSGTLVKTDSLNTSVFDGHVTHSSKGAFQNTWSFDWIAPSSGSGDVTFYAAIVKNGYSGGVVTASAAFTESALSIEEFEEIALHLYPNPVEDELNIQVPVAGNKAASVTIFSVNGQRVLSDHIESVNNMISKSYDLSNLKSGVYFAHIELGNDQVINRRFVIK